MTAQKLAATITRSTVVQRKSKFVVTCLDGSTDVGKVLCSQGYRTRLLNELVISQSRELQSEILQSIFGLVDQQNV